MLYRLFFIVFACLLLGACSKNTVCKAPAEYVPFQFRLIDSLGNDLLDSANTAYVGTVSTSSNCDNYAPVRQESFGDSTGHYLCISDVLHHSAPSMRSFICNTVALKYSFAQPDTLTFEYSVKNTNNCDTYAMQNVLFNGKPVTPTQSGGKNIYVLVK